MYKFLRVTCAFLAAALAVACVILGIYFGLSAALLCAAGTLLLFVCSMFFKYLQECKEEKISNISEQTPPSEYEPKDRH